MRASLLLGLTVLIQLGNVLARPSSNAVWAADSAIARKQGNGLDSNGNPSVSYEHGELWWGLRLLYERTGNQSYFDYILNSASNIVADDGSIHSNYKVSDYSLDPVRTGPAFLYLFNKTSDSKWKKAADTYMTQLHSHPRTTQGQFWHKLIYPNQGWLDGIYMGDVFYSQYTNDFQKNNLTAWADITAQFQLMFNNTLQNATSPPHLLYHGYDHSFSTVWASPDRGHSPEVWDRALGWYVMALVDVLDIMPVSNPGHRVLLNILQTLAPRIRDAADANSGVWWLVITQPGRAGNYFESSGAAMFVYGLLKGIRRGYISDSDGSIVAAMKKAYSYFLKNFVVPNPNGTMDWTNTVSVGSLSTTGDYNYYISQTVDTNDLKGVGAFLLASVEFEQL
ncbi:glycoside hydrolase family 105 protein [Dendrothele bispora CBS 962.96]|uniref:Glycoside hydrolase family 105 protein n=1 Tax=Dendrothele bispora (strain CBS 962.96) TaxID=1314807 RepID=A0A4S8L8R2_DENBC|nr:glycoside hydrolase family 105 protein [Dendrothele bispora CBS 962.96]